MQHGHQNQTRSTERATNQAPDLPGPDHPGPPLVRPARTAPDAQPR